MSNPLAKQLLAQTKKQQAAQQKFEAKEKEKASRQASRPEKVPSAKKLGRPLGSIIRDILQALDPHKGLNKDDVIKAARINAAQWPVVEKELVVNPNVVHKDGLFFHKTQYRLRDAEALAKLVHETYEGIEADSLRDAYSGAAGDIERLVSQRRLLSIVNVDTKRPVLYPLYTPYPVPISADVKQLWESIRIPDDVDLERALREAQLSTQMQARTLKRPAPKKKAGKQQPQRKIKLTNVHIDEVDLNQDFVKPAPASGSAAATR